ncbi:MAG: CHAT domain-containing protein [Okeania sp. SIO3I5]|uniref:pentapeptide repeat-containing protein n=1 Tax=Okeania sp. SIO3I5 TaxID=2607805 RepID=UPI0013B7B820|nr:pentapeptide repeat-containing protein [Okeania sp. SIO3I5]NEQ37213.1 CHAT domain-containing protein [Okeania sp. SIO3I5]
MLIHSSKQPRKNYQCRSFKNQDLTGEDFSFADIRGADFTGANLTGAKFNYALAGLTKSQTRLIFILVVILFLAAGIAAGGATVIPIRLISSRVNQVISIQIGAVVFPILEFINIGLLVIIVRQGIKKIWWHLFSLIILILTIAVIFASLGFSEKKIVNFFSFFEITHTSPSIVIKLSKWLADFRFGQMIRAITNFLTDNGDSENKTVIILFSLIICAIAILMLIFTLSLGVILAEIISDKRPGNSAVIWVNIIAAVLTGIATKNQIKRWETPYVIMLIILAIAIYLTLILIAQHLAKKILAEDQNNLFILKFAVAIGAIKGTCFKNANLTDADFSHAVLKSTNFRFVNATRTFWRETKYLKFARVEATILEDIKVRELLITGWGKDQQYIEANLRGANLMSADLSNANLKLADLGEASLQAANLNNANLTEALAIGTNFTTAQMSGTCLEAWNIDHTTILDNIESKYIYLLEKPKPETDDRERRPSSGYFQEGDFTKLFQEVLNTVDLIFRNGVDFKAFMSSFQQVKVENQGIPIEIQSMENKGDGVVVVKIDVPPETNKEKIHREFVQIYDENVRLLEEKYQQELAVIEKQVSLNRRKTEETEYRMFFMNQLLKIQNPARTISREKLVILNFEGGNFTTGFTGIKAYIWSDGHPLPTSFASHLTANKKIPQLYQDWSEKYQKLRDLHSFFSRIKVKSDQATNVSTTDAQKIISQIQELEKKLQLLLNKWLTSPSFAQIENQLRTKINSSDRVRLIIQSSDVLMQRLPWHLWNFFSDYKLAETAIALPEANRVEKLNIAREKIRILAIFGNDKSLNLAADEKSLLTLGDEAEIIFLVQPNRQELDEKLWDEKGWDIICFSGHSKSEKDGSTGYFDLGDRTKLKIEELENALTIAISRGLKLAIFNSCDGLGLARQFARLHIPAIIVMREPVPDVVAQQFFQNFMQLFASGKSLYISMRQAREKLQGMEHKFPSATWLPIICQNAAEVPPSWQNLHGIYKPNLAETLTELRLAIATETCLTPADKKEALQQVEILTEVGEFPTGKNQDVVRSAIIILRDIVAEYPAATLINEAVEKLFFIYSQIQNFEQNGNFS